MRNLIVDIGNTRTKFAVTEAGKVVREEVCERFSPAALRDRLTEWRVARAIVSSTRGDASAVVETLRAAGVETLLFTPGVAVPLRSDYLTPGTLGCDRLAAAVGADLLFPGRTVLIVDFGTAVTLDVVSGGCFRGGFISPGLRTRFRALHDYTAALPEAAPAEEWLPLGRTTVECIQQGVEQGLACEIEGQIARLRAEFGELSVIFTGGDAKRFAKRIKNTIFADCDPVIAGLNRILEYHVHTEK